MLVLATSSGATGSNSSTLSSRFRSSYSDGSTDDSRVNHRQLSFRFLKQLDRKLTLLPFPLVVPQSPGSWGAATPQVRSSAGYGIRWGLYCLIAIFGITRHQGLPQSDNLSATGDRMRVCPHAKTLEELYQCPDSASWLRRSDMRCGNWVSWTKNTCCSSISSRYSISHTLSVTFRHIGTQGYWLVYFQKVPSDISFKTPFHCMSG